MWIGGREVSQTMGKTMRVKKERIHNWVMTIRKWAGKGGKGKSEAGQTAT